MMTKIGTEGCSLLSSRQYGVSENSDAHETKGSFSLEPLLLKRSSLTFKLWHISCPPYCLCIWCKRHTISAQICCPSFRETVKLMESCQESRIGCSDAKRVFLHKEGGRLRKQYWLSEKATSIAGSIRQRRRRRKTISNLEVKFFAHFSLHC